MRTSRTGNGSKFVSRQLRPKWLASTTTLYAAGFAIAVGTLLMPMSQSYAQTIRWNGSSDNNWQTGGNWTGGGGNAPVATSDVEIYNPPGNRPDPTLSGNASVRAVEVNNGGVLTIDGRTAPGGATLESQNDVTVGDGGIFGFGKIIIEDKGTLRSTNGVVDIEGGDIDVNAGGTINDDVVVRNQGGGRTGTLTNGGTITGTTDIRGATVTNELGGTMIGKVTVRDTAREGTLTNDGEIGQPNMTGTALEVVDGGSASNNRVIYGNVEVDDDNESEFINNVGAIVHGTLVNAGDSTNRGAIGALINTDGKTTNYGTIAGPTTIAGGEVENKAGGFLTGQVVIDDAGSGTSELNNYGEIGFGGSPEASLKVIRGQANNYGVIHDDVEVGQNGTFFNDSNPSAIVHGTLINAGNSTNRGAIGALTNTDGKTTNYGTIAGPTTITGGEVENKSGGFLTGQVVIDDAGSGTSELNNYGEIGFGGSPEASLKVIKGQANNYGVIHDDVEVGQNGTFNNNSSGIVHGTLINAGNSTNRGALGALTNIGGKTTNYGTVAGPTTITGGEVENKSGGLLTGQVVIDDAGSGTSVLNNYGEIGFGGSPEASLKVIKGQANNYGVVHDDVEVGQNGTFNNNIGGIVHGTLINAGNSTNRGTLGALTNNSGTTTNYWKVNGTTDVNGGSVINTATGTLTGLVTITDGAVSNSGTIVNGVSVGADGEFYNQAGGQVGGTLQNRGLAQNLAGGTLRTVENWGTFTNAGVVTQNLTNNNGTTGNTGEIRGNLINTGGTTTNDGQVKGTTYVTGGGVINSATGTLTGKVTIDDGVVANAGAIVNGVTVGANGEFSNQAGGQVGGTLVNSGVAENLAGGTLQAVENSGTFTNAGIVAQNLTNTNTAINTGQIQGHLINNDGKTTNSGTVEKTTKVNGGVVENTGTLVGAVDVGQAGRLVSTGNLGSGLTNRGIATLSGSVTGSIVNESTGQFNLAGPLAVTGGSFDNRGKFASTSGSIIGLTSFNNQGDIFVDGSLGMQTGTLTNTGNINVNGTLNVTAGTFTNSNKISMVDNEINDRINLTGNLAHTGTIEVDVNLSGQNSGGEQLADLITVSGETSGNGVIHFNDVGNGGQRLFVNPIVIIDGGASTANYTAAYLPQPGGLIEYDFIRYEKAPDNVDYVIKSSVNPAAGSIAGSLALVNAMLGTVVNRPSSAFVSGLAYEPEKNSCGVGPWGRGTGGYIKGSGDTSNGETSRTSEVEVRYGGYQTGADFQCFSFRDTGWDIAVGGFGGFNMGTVSQEIDLTQVGSKFNQFYGGAYIMAAKGAFAAELQGRFDYTDYTFDSSRLGLNDAEANSYRTALSATASYGFTRGDYSFVPTVGVSVSNTTTDDLPFSDAYDLEFERHLAVVGFAGATIARSFLNSDKTAAYRPFVTGTVYTDFGGEAESLFKDNVSGASQLLNSEGIGTFGEVSVGLDYVRILPENRMGVNQLNATIRGDAKFSDRLQSAGGTIQLRLQF